MTARLRAFLDREATDTGLPVRTLLGVALVVHVAMAFIAVNPWHPDEQFQILEFAWVRAGLAPAGGLPWEFAAHIRSALQPTLAVALLKVLRGLGVTSPYPWAFLLRLLTVAAAFVVMLQVIAHAARILGPRGRRVVWLTSLFLWFVPFLHFRFTSENLGGLALTAAIPFLEGLEGEGPSRDGHDAVAGVLLGLSFLFRFQMALAFVPLLLWLGLHRPRGWRRAVRIALIIVGVVAVGALVDRWFYGAWVLTPWNYVRVNILEGVATTFGTAPWYAYFVQFPLWAAPPLGVALLLLVVVAVSWRPRSPWVWATVGFVVGHMLVPHKELRFLFPLLYALPVLLAFGVEAVESRVPGGQWRTVTAWVLGLQNVVLLALLLTPSIHHGKEFDWHYLHFLWQTAEAHPGQPVYVLDTEGSPYRVWDWDTNVYRHPRVQGVTYQPGDTLSTLVPEGVPPDRLLVMTRSDSLPDLVGARSFDLVYVAEPGYRIMARWVGLENAGFIRWLERVDRWTNSEWVRRVYEVHRPDARPASGVTPPDR